MAIDSFYENGQTLAILGSGRNPDERSIVVVEKGNFLGFGYIGQDASIVNLDAARSFVKPAKENRMAQNVINSFLRNPKGADLIPLGPVNGLVVDH